MGGSQKGDRRVGWAAHHRIEGRSRSEHIAWGCDRARDAENSAHATAIDSL